MTEQNSQVSALADQAKSELGDKLFKPIMEAAQRACATKGISEEYLMQVALRHGFSIIEAEAVDQLDREASDGNKASENLRYQWRDHKYPQSRGARWRRGEG